MTAIDDRTVSPTDMATGHFKLGRVLLGIISNPTLTQPMSWEQVIWPHRLELRGQYFGDGATLDVRRVEIAAFAAEFGLTVNERTRGDEVRVKAEGIYEGVELSVWGMAPRDGGEA